MELSNRHRLPIKQALQQLEKGKKAIENRLNLALSNWLSMVLHRRLSHVLFIFDVQTVDQFVVTRF